MMDTSRSRTGSASAFKTDAMSAAESSSKAAAKSGEQQASVAAGLRSKEVTSTVCQDLTCCVVLMMIELVLQN